MDKKMLGGILLWIPFLFIKITLVLSGLIVVPLALATRYLSLEILDKDTVRNHWPDIFWLWGNDEEGCPDWWVRRCIEGWVNPVAAKFPQFWWYAIRNPINNLRFLFDDVDASELSDMTTNWHPYMMMEPYNLIKENVKYAYYLVRYKWKVGFRIVWLGSNNRYSEIWFGWKLASGVPGLGFTTQIRINREIGE